MAMTSGREREWKRDRERESDGEWRMETESCLAAFNTNASFHAISNPNSIWVILQRILLTAVSVRHTHTHSILSKQMEGGGGGEAKGEGGAIALSKLAAVASGYWSSGGLALLIWFTNRTRRPPHIVTHYYYYSQTPTHTHSHRHTRTHTLARTHSHTLTCSAVLPQCFWQTHLVHLLHLLRRLPHFNCFCSHTHIRIQMAEGHTHTYTHL